MTEPYLVFHVALLATTILITIASAIGGRSRPANVRRLAKVCRGLGIAVAVLGAIGTVSGLVLTAGATAAPGLADADRSRMWTNGLAESGYNALLAAVVAIPALLIARRALRRA